MKSYSFLKIGVDIWFMICYNNQAPRETVLKTWGCSSPGRALEWHSRGKGFDPPHLHQKALKTLCFQGFFASRKLFLFRGTILTLI